MLKSMTGFGRGEYEDEQFSVTIEMKTVNHRYNEVAIRLPRFLNPVEDRIRKTILKSVNRGRIDVFINASYTNTENVSIKVDKALVLAYHNALRKSERTRVRANSFDKNEVLKVIRFLATYSSDVFTANLNDLDKNALTYVLRALNQPKDAPNTQPNYMYHLLISNPAWLLDYSEEKLEGLMKDGASDFNSVRKNMKD